jgi:hypothetical protein
MTKMENKGEWVGEGVEHLGLFCVAGGRGGHEEG